MVRRYTGSVARKVETLLVPDASLERGIWDMLASLPIPTGDLFVEPDDTFPGEELAVDVYAGTAEELAHRVDTIRQELRRRFSLDVETASECEARLVSA